MMSEGSKTAVQVGVKNDIKKHGKSNKKHQHEQKDPTKEKTMSPKSYQPSTTTEEALSTSRTEG